jgi:hypothetical protein
MGNSFFLLDRTDGIKFAVFSASIAAENYCGCSIANAAALQLVANRCGRLIRILRVRSWNQLRLTRARAYSFGDDDRPPRTEAQGISLHSSAKLA